MGVDDVSGLSLVNLQIWKHMKRQNRICLFAIEMACTCQPGFIMNMSTKKAHLSLIQCFGIRLSQDNQETWSILVYQSWRIILLNCQMQQIKLASQTLFTKTEGENLKTEQRRKFLMQLLLRPDSVNVTQVVVDCLWQPLVKCKRWVGSEMPGEWRQSSETQTIGMSWPQV